jgi:pyruvate/2-oxoglutarate dehydrogenase complex dihydrolipoamide acyltransferase (E2) component
MQPSAHQPATEVASIDVAAAATTWTDLLGFWTGRFLTDKTQPLAMFAEARRATEQALRISQTVFEANRMVADAVHDAARQQQEQAFTAASAALAALADIPGDAARQAAAESMKRLATACTEVCSRNREAAWSLTGSMLGATSQATS